MAQFIQANQLSGVQGSLGQQSLVSAPEPTTADLAGPVIQAADVAGDIYSQSKAKSIVSEELENVEAARAAAESGQFGPGSDVPESLKVDQKEWDMIAGAVANGSMSREGARLLASSRLRSRIAEEPLFADRMRKAASGVLGFNIESEGARQYFSSFATNASLAQQKNAEADKEREKMMNQARRFKETGMFSSVEAGYKMLVKNNAAKMRVELAKNELAVDGINSQEFGSKFIQEEHVTAWGSFLGEVKAFETEQGKAIDGVAFSRITDERKQDAVARFNTAWGEGGAPLNTPAYDRALEGVVNIYDEMKDFSESYGVDNLTSIEIERNIQARELFGDKYFSTMKTITQNFGQQVASDVISLTGVNASQRERMFKNNEQLRNAYGLAGADPAEFNKVLGTVGVDILEGNSLEGKDPAVVDAAATFLYNSGNKATMKATVQSMFEGGQVWKGTSLAASKDPRQTPQENIDTLNRQYKEGVKPLMTQLSNISASDPTINFSIGGDGKVVVSQDSAQGAMPNVDPTSGLVTNPRQVQARLLSFRNAKQTANKLNTFAQAHNNGWSGQFGETLDEYSLRVEKLGKDGTVNAQAALIKQTNASMGLVADLIGNNKTDEAEEEYNQLREDSPLLYRYSFDEVLDRALGE